MRGTMNSMATLMAQADLDEDTPAAWRLLLAEMLRLAQAVHDAHLARSESEQARRLADEARTALDNVRARLRPLGALWAELLAVVGPAEEDAGHGQVEAARRRPLLTGRGALRPEQFALTIAGRASPKRSCEVGR